MLHILERGDTAVTEKEQEVKYAAKYQFGRTIVYIDDSYVAKDEKTKQAILAEISQIILSIIEDEGA